MRGLLARTAQAPVRAVELPPQTKLSIEGVRSGVRSRSKR